MAENTAVVPPRSALVELLRSVGDGSLEDDVSEVIRDLVEKIQSVASTSGGKPTGKIKLNIGIKFDRGIFEVDADVSVTEPKTVRPRTLMYAAPGGGLSRNNPQQLEAFREPESKDRPLRGLSSI